MKKWITITFLLFGQFIGASSFAQVRLPRIVRDSMVLQRDQPINIWGWASPGEKITIQFDRKKYLATTKQDGRWSAQLRPMKAGGPYTMQIKGKNTIQIKNILMGDVWYCSGQSNMTHYLQLHQDRYAAEIKAANYPALRQFRVTQTALLDRPGDDLSEGNWVAADNKGVLEFSVVAYFFAKELYEKYKVPIGIINASVGGPPIEAWISEEGLKTFPAAIATLQKNKDKEYIALRNKESQLAAAQQPSLGPLDAEEKRFAAGLAHSSWTTINVPGFFEDQGQVLNGVVWYIKEILLPDTFTSIPARLLMGRIVDADEVYVNGQLVGKTTYQYPQRRYQVPAGLLKAGKNTIAVRVLNQSGKGGMVPDKPYQLLLGNQILDLSGSWKFHIHELFQQPSTKYQSFQPHYQPAALFNGMTNPLQRYSIKGILWYQGESNTGDAALYQQLLPALIKDWRRLWKQENLPFLFVQLPNFGPADYSGNRSDWAALREAQRKTLSVSNTAMAVTIDLGEWNDLHPGRKKEIGERLALAARKMVYGEKALVAAGPGVTAVTGGQDGKLRIQFSDDAPLVTKDGKDPNWFFIAGHDKKFLPAQTQLLNNTVIVWNTSIKHPVYVRYAWADNPQDCNLYSAAGLPAAPFEEKLTTATNTGAWNGRQSAVVLSYDDGLNSHLAKAIPALDSFGLKGSFYISDHAGDLPSQIEGWKKAALNGHELGNHTIYHPCTGGSADRAFVKPGYDLRHYGVKRLQDEILAMNTLLRAIDGSGERTFAFPCSDTKIGDTAYLAGISKNFLGARAVRAAMPSLQTVDVFDLPAYMINGQTGDELIALVKEAMEKKALLVFLFHGVGGDHSLNVSEQAHETLLRFLNQQNESIWVAPMKDVIRYITSTQQKAAPKQKQ